MSKIFWLVTGSRPAAGQARRHARLEAREGHHSEPVGDPIGDLLLGQVEQPPQWKGDVVGHRHEVEQGIVLKQHADLLAELLQLEIAHAEDVLASDEDAPGLGLDEPDDGLQEHALAARAGTDEAVEAALGHEQVHPAQDWAVERLGDAF
jgi:hypothetical protein